MEAIRQAGTRQVDEEAGRPTPGPWKVSADMRTGRPLIVDSGEIVAAVQGPPDNAEATARLLAAAPDLLAALEAADEASRLRSWAMGADDYRANEEAHQAQIEAVRLRNEALIKAGVRTEARPPAGVENE